MIKALGKGAIFMEEEVEAHVIFSGRVQGVFFRATVQEVAEAMRIPGTVRNLPDGNVKMVAQGTERELEELIERLKNNAGYARVDHAEVNYQPIDKNYHSFSITY